MKKLLSVFLSVLLVVQLVVPVWAAEPAAETDPAAPETAQETTQTETADALLAPGTRIFGAQYSPLHGDEAMPNRITPPQYYAAAAAVDPDDFYTEDADVLEAIASGMEQRKSTITVPWCIPASAVSTEDDLLALSLAALALAMSHTGEPARGDYLLLSYNYLEYGAEVLAYENGCYYIRLVYDNVVYYTTAAQEAALTAKLEQVMASFGFTAATDEYTKIKTIYNYICANVSYDEENKNDSGYLPMFSAYAALMDGKAVCQGYATLLYRMLLMAGVDNRVIVGESHGAGHAWNIVQLGDFCYELDSTWDAGVSEYAFFLRSPANFPDHTRDAAYESADFHALYPMAAADYVYSENPVIAAGTCGDGVTWSLSVDGTMTISGTGAMDDYDYVSETPWVNVNDDIVRVVVEEGVTRVGNNAFGSRNTVACPNLTAVSCAANVIGEYAFGNCSAMTSVQLLEGVEELEEYAFYSTPMGSIMLPDSLRSIGDSAFSGCHATSVTFGSGPLTIGASSFNHNDFAEVYIPDNVTAIGTYCFSYCEKLETVTVGSGVKKLDRNTFANCPALKNVTLSEGLETLGFWVFIDSPLLTTLTLPASLKSIDQVFNDCPNLKELIFLGDRPTFTGKAERGSIGAGPCFYPCTNPTWNSDIHADHSTLWVPNHQCVNGVCVLCGAAEIYAYGSRGEGGSALWIVDVNYTATYYGDGGNPSVGIPSAGGDECQTLVKKAVFMPEIGYIADYAFTRDWEKLRTLVFLGDAPEMYSKCFSNITVTAYYPADNPTWTKSVRQNYGGKITWKPLCSDGHTYVGGVCDYCGAKDPNYVPPADVTRIFGADRYETAFKTAEVLKQQLGVEKFDNIVVACGDNFADALGGSYLAAKKGAPILLVKSSKIDAVKSYIKANLNPGGTVYLLGGTAAIPAAMDKGLSGFNVKRLAGATRYDTNLLILQEAGVTDEDILICTGKNFADSLSAAAAGRPILLVKDSLNDSQKAFLQSHAANKKYILGGTAAVSTRVENQAKAYGSVKRIGGNTRYETSVLIAKEFFPNAKQAALAYAQNFPDGLSGGALAYAMKAPLVLTASGKEAAAAAYAKEQGITSGVIFGGNVLISDKAARTIFQMKSGDTIKIG